MPGIAVLISGGGTNLQALIDNVHGQSSAEIVLVLSNRSNAYGLERAKKASIPTRVFALRTFTNKTGKGRTEYDAELAGILNESKPDLIVLAGWMHILSSSFLEKITTPIINLHPALPGEYDGAGAIDRAYADFQQGKTDHTGVMVHYVVAEVDRGEPILTRRIPINKGDSIEDLESRIHGVEHELIVEATKNVLSL